ncbi:hypothetical protein [Halobacillus seohaensis]|uniref:Uncharacterized protein n=1 Tax=Halobacillus seohaensis TaxID=447421 RepID=A0ABW2EHS7_9BACI
MGAYWFHGTMFEGDQTKYGELFVNGDKFNKPSQQLNEQVVNMGIDRFIVAPGQVMVDTCIPLSRSPSPLEDCTSYIKKGCTLLLVQQFIYTNRHYRMEYEQLVKKMSDLAIDFMIVPRISSHVLQPEMIRFYARQKSPFIIVSVENLEDLQDIPWGWMVQAQCNRRIPFTYSVKKRRNSEMNYERFWTNICTKYGIIKLTNPIKDGLLTLNNIKDTGIYPYKGALTDSAFADYNLYERNVDELVDEGGYFLYHDAIPNVTVMRGQLLQINQKLESLTKGIHFKSSIYKHFV